MTWDHAGWLANVLLIVGLWYVGERRRWAFLATFAGEVAWAVVSWHVGTPSMVFICVTFAALALRNYARWGAPEAGPGGA